MPATTENPTLTGRFDEALTYARALHRDQIRKGSDDVPYLAHLMATAAHVLEDGGSEDEAIAALLHDALEDQHERTNAEDIADRFGARVAAIVEACSDREPGAHELWRVRKERYLAGIVDKDASALRVSNADKLHNARCVLRDYRSKGDRLWEQFNPESDQLWYYRELADAFLEHNPGHLADELDRVVTQLEALAAADG